SQCGGPDALRHAQGRGSRDGDRRDPVDQQGRRQVRPVAQGVRAQATPRPLLRPIELGDLEALADLDARYARATGQSQVMDRASVHYYLRSGHSFVAERVQLGAAKPAGHSEGQAELDGFVLAHSTWSGRTAVVRVER